MHWKWMLLAYLVGQIFYWLLKAQAVANSTLNGFPRGWKGVPAYLAHYWVILLVRFASCFACLVLIVAGGVSFSPEFIPEMAKTNMLVAVCFAFFVGLGMDAILEKFQDKIAWLKGAIPPPPPPPESNGHAEAAGAGK